MFHVLFIHLCQTFPRIPFLCESCGLNPLKSTAAVNDIAKNGEWKTADNEMILIRYTSLITNTFSILQLGKFFLEIHRWGTLISNQQILRHITNSVEYWIFENVVYARNRSKRMTVYCVSDGIWCLMRVGQWRIRGLNKRIEILWASDMVAISITCLIPPPTNTQTVDFCVGAQSCLNLCAARR